MNQDSTQSLTVLQQLSVAIIYDHLVVKHGGAEVVLESIHKLFPNAPIYSPVALPTYFGWISPSLIKTSMLNKYSFFAHHFRWLAPLYPLAVESFDLSKYDLVISVSAGPAKGIISNPNQLHICYQLTPPRYLYDTPRGYIEATSGFGNLLLRWLTRPFFKYLRWWDQVAAHRPDKVIAISNLVRNRIEKFYAQKTDAVIYPPFHPLNPSKVPPKLNNHKFLLMMTRLVSYKGVDTAIQAALQSNQKLVIAGEGTQKDSLIQLAGAAAYVKPLDQPVPVALANAITKNKSIIFLGSITNLEKAQLFASAHALLMPGLEDFGIVGLEAASQGLPVICHKKSGIAEVLRHYKEAVHLSRNSVPNLIQAIKQLDNQNFPPERLINRANDYCEKEFLETFAKTTYKFWNNHSTI